MIRRVIHPRLRMGIVRLMVSGLTAAALFSTPSPASAQIAPVGSPVNALIPGGVMRGSDTAWDPRFGVYLIVVGNGPVYGVFADGYGRPISAPFVIMSIPGAWAHFPRVAYSPDVLGGQGGFVVTWHHNIDAAATVHCVFSRTVSWAMPGYLVSGIQQISDGAQGGTWHETGPAMAYSTTSHRFLVAWRTKPYGIQGRFVDSNGTPFGNIQDFENPGGSRDPSVTWNQGTDEFGLVYTGFGASGAFATFRHIRASDGLLSARTTFGFGPGTFATAIDVNWNNQYIVAWSLHPGTMTAAINPDGQFLYSMLVTSRLGFDQSLGMSFNKATGTFLVVSSDASSLEVGALEVNHNGGAMGTSQLITSGAKIGSFYPLVAPRAATNQWDVVYSRDFQGAESEVVETASRGGGFVGVSPTPPPPPPPGGPVACTTADPFVSLGGGRCINGGWLPPIGGVVTPPPAPVPPTPPPPSPQPGCPGADPFAALGGGSCVNGGWVPRISTCSTPDPFASLGGGQCVNGGWVPRASGSVCSTPDPFASLGGGVCVGGGWRPRASLDRVPDPLGGAGEAGIPARESMRFRTRLESRPVTG
jgi:hypothetical protein